MNVAVRRHAALQRRDRRRRSYRSSRVVPLAASSGSIRSSPRRRPATRSRTSRSSTATCCAGSARRRCSRGTSRPSSAGEVRPLSEFGADGSRGLLVYHASIGEPTVSAFLLSRPEPIVLVYHNITPAKYFDGIDDTFAELLVLGRLELESIRHRVTLAIADSHFNAAELEAIGYDDVRVIRPVVDPFRLVRTEPDAATAEPLRRRVRRADAAVRRPAAAAQAARSPREGDARRRDLLRRRGAACCSSARTGSRATPTRSAPRSASSTSRTCTSSARSTTRGSRRCSAARSRS